MNFDLAELSTTENLFNAPFKAEERVCDARFFLVDISPIASKHDSL
jgi:hypothetical protein